MVLCAWAHQEAHLRMCQGAQVGDQAGVKLPRVAGWEHNPDIVQSLSAPHAASTCSSYACSHLDHQFGVQAVERCVCAVGEGAHWIGVLPVFGDEGGNLLSEACISAILLSLAVYILHRQAYYGGRVKNPVSAACLL
eukprot:1159572-Pelagomonas_calceolata.AAC.8